MKRIQISRLAAAIAAMILKFKESGRLELWSGFALRHPYLEALNKKNKPGKYRVTAYSFCCVYGNGTGFMNWQAGKTKSYISLPQRVFGLGKGKAVQQWAAFLFSAAS